MNAKAGEHRRSELYAALTSQTLRATIDPLQANRPLFHYVIRRHWNLRNLTLKKECCHTTGMLPYKHFARSLEIFPPAQYFRTAL